MSGYTAAALWLGFCALIITTFAAASKLAQRRAAREDATYQAHRTPNTGAPATVTPTDWHPNADWWTNTTAEPIYQQLCADTAQEAARYIDTEWWLENGGGAA